MIDKLKNYAIVAVILGIAVLTYVLTKGKSPIPSAKKEMEVIKLKSEVKKLQAEQGLEASLRAVEDKYAQRLHALDEASAEQADALRSDPVALAEFLVRNG